jgi:hypothetical protein
MPDTVSVFIPADELLPIDELLELTGQDNITRLQTDAGEPIGYRVVWDDVTLTIQWEMDNAQRGERIRGFLALCDDLLGKRRDKKAKKIWRRAERMTNIIDCTADPDWDDDRQAQLLVQGVMAYYDYALMLGDDTVYNENGNIEVGRDASQPKYWVEQVEIEINEGETNARKKRSINQLKKEKIPFIPHLPPIADEANTVLRPAEDVAQRAMALNLISRRADGASYDWYLEQVDQYHLRDVVTDDEWEFAADADDPPDYVVVKFSRRMESYWLFLWALGFIKGLSRPTAFCEADRANEILDTRSSDQFLLEARLRPKREILDARDLHYRYHWAVVDAELYGNKPPRGLKQAVVYERHYALNWLVYHRGQAWDAITTDT